MRLDWAMLCNAAEGPDNGLVYILGAGIDTLNRPQYPAPFLGALVARLVAARSEADRPHVLEIQCNDEDGKAILPQPITLPVGRLPISKDLPVGWGIGANIVANLQAMPIPHDGRYSFEILVDGVHQKSLPFRALLIPEAAG